MLRLVAAELLRSRGATAGPWTGQVAPPEGGDEFIALAAVGTSRPVPRQADPKVKTLSKRCSTARRSPTVLRSTKAVRSASSGPTQPHGLCHVAGHRLPNLGKLGEDKARDQASATSAIRARDRPLVRLPDGESRAVATQPGSWPSQEERLDNPGQGGWRTAGRPRGMSGVCR